MKRRAKALRAQGASYEEIAEELSEAIGGGTVLRPWGVYAWCNPHKFSDQIGAWIKRHHPDWRAWETPD